VQFQKLSRIITRSLDELDLADTDVSHGVDALNLAGDGLAHGVVDQLLNKFLKLDGASLLAHDGNHALADLLDLGALGVGELGDLVGSRLGETNAEETDLVAILGLHINVGLDESLPLLHQRLELVGGVGETIEVGEAVLSLDLIDLEFDVGIAVLLVLLQISQVDGNNSSLQVVGSDVVSRGSVHRGNTGVSVGEESGGLDVVPVLLLKRINDLLLSLSLLLESWWRHDVREACLLTRQKKGKGKEEDR